jgi:hypothetical protein
MHVFSTKVAQLAGAPPDPTKHVRFTDGMILGVDDFNQEFAYLSHRDRWIVRDLIGYGTASGLRVWMEDDGSKGPRVVVEPGVAVTPRGELVRVPVAQCAHLNEWLGGADQVRHLQDRPAPLSPPGDRVDLYVVLCYRECELDHVPIPGEPCRHEDDMTAPSRIMDDFRLELRFVPPEQPDEAATRDFVDWLAMIPIVEGPSSLSLEEFLAEIRLGTIGSPPTSPPDFMYGQPPGTIRIGRSDACQYLRAAYRVWITELRPKWHAVWWPAHTRCDGSRTDAPAPTPESCLLLARLDVPLVPSGLTGPARWRVPGASSVIVDERLRPILVPLRMVQEWLWCGWRAGAAAGGSGSAIVAGGEVVVGAPPSGPFQLVATEIPRGFVAITFKGFTFPGAQYAIAALGSPGGPLRNPRLEYSGTTPIGITLRVRDNTAAPSVPMAGLVLMVQITQVA